MKGTVLLIKEDQSLTVLEDIDYAVYKKLASQKESDQLRCTINNREVTFASISKVVWNEATFDWDYGY